ncbi:MAG: hypothetical protein QY309_01355 [Cyclobacteriaceae bacterium]|nr:MAG: hypothetical protein QY309_01355 [Cyclobacteriaceae bacterium]
MLRKFLLIHFLFAGATSTVFAQNNSADTLFIRSAINYARKLNDEVTYREWGLYTGSHYLARATSDETFPYFLTSSLSKGEIIYQGERYDVSLLYDVHRDKLIIQHYEGFLIELVSQSVSAFSFNGHKFKRFSNLAERKNQVGFYEILYDGETKFLAKRVKVSKEIVERGGVKVNYSQRDIFFIVKGDSFYKVQSKKSVLSALLDQEQNLKKYIRASDIHFNHHREEAIRNILQFYDSQKQ